MKGFILQILYLSTAVILPDCDFLNTEYTNGTHCIPLTVCNSKQYQTVSATRQTDRQCSALLTCDHGSWVSKQPTPTTDRECKDCTSSFALNEFGSTGYSRILNANSCTNHTVCQKGYYVRTPPTSTSDRYCVECIFSYTDTINAPNCLPYPAIVNGCGRSNIVSGECVYPQIVQTPSPYDGMNSYYINSTLHLNTVSVSTLLAPRIESLTQWALHCPLRTVGSNVHPELQVPGMGILPSLSNGNIGIVPFSILPAMYKALPYQEYMMYSMFSYLYEDLILADIQNFFLFYPTFVEYFNLRYNVSYYLSTPDYCGCLLNSHIEFKSKLFSYQPSTGKWLQRGGTDLNDVHCIVGNVPYYYTNSPTNSPTSSPTISLPTAHPSEVPSFIMPTHRPTSISEPIVYPNNTFTPLSGITPIACNTSYTGNTTADGTNIAGFSSPEVFYRLTLNESQTITLNLCDSDFNNVIRIVDSNTNQEVFMCDGCIEYGILCDTHKTYITLIPITINSTNYIGVKAPNHATNWNHNGPGSYNDDNHYFTSNGGPFLANATYIVVIEGHETLQGAYTLQSTCSTPQPTAAPTVTSPTPAPISTMPTEVPTAHVAPTVAPTTLVDLCTDEITDIPKPHDEFSHNSPFTLTLNINEECSATHAILTLGFKSPILNKTTIDLINPSNQTIRLGNSFNCYGGGIILTTFTNDPNYDVYGSDCPIKSVQRSVDEITGSSGRWILNISIIDMNGFIPGTVYNATLTLRNDSFITVSTTGQSPVVTTVPMTTTTDTSNTSQLSEEDSDEVDLTLILGLSIPGGVVVLTVVGTAVYYSCKTSRSF